MTEEGRVQLAYHILQISSLVKVPEGYIQERFPDVWVSKRATHIYNHQTERIESLDDNIVYCTEKVFAKPDGPRFNTFEELEAAVVS